MPAKPPEPRILPGLTMDELAEAYLLECNRRDAFTLDLGDFLPDFYTHVRPIAPGDVVVVMADTGNCKTLTLQHIAQAFHPEPVMFFELEVTGALLFERFAAFFNGLRPVDVEQRFKTSPHAIGAVDWQGLSHIWTCTESRLNLNDVEATVRAAIDHKIPGILSRPKAVFLDYLGLFSASEGTSRYERITSIADNLRPLAKTLNIALFVSVQIHRKGDNQSPEVGLHDAKDSGNIEQAATLLLGQWIEGDTLNLRICKNTKGRAGPTIAARWNGDLMQITSRTPVLEPADLGEHYSP